jgi:hypothetical protein
MIIEIFAKMADLRTLFLVKLSSFSVFSWIALFVLVSYLISSGNFENHTNTNKAIHEKTEKLDNFTRKSVR